MTLLGPRRLPASILAVVLLTTAMLTLRPDRAGAEQGSLGTIGPGGTTCSPTFSSGTTPLDLQRYKYEILWKGTSSGGVPAWRLELYDDNLPVDGTIGTEKWKRVDSSGDRNVDKKWEIEQSFLLEDGTAAFRVCLRNLGAQSLQGTWDLRVRIEEKPRGGGGPPPEHCFYEPVYNEEGDIVDYVLVCDDDPLPPPDL
jgi:hypothetical protein